MKRLLALILLLSAINMPAGAKSTAPGTKDFAYGIPIATETEAPIYEIEVPAAVYRHVYRRDLGDIRVFNNRGEVMPHALSPPTQPVKQHPATDVPFFPLPANRTKNGENVSLNIATDASGTIIDVQTGKKGQKPAHPAAWLLDLSRIKDHRPEKLVLQFNGQTDDPPDDFTATVSIAASNDLAEWHSLVRSASVASLRFAGRHLVKNTIALPATLPATRMPYLRLTWPQSKAAPALTEVTVHFPEKRRAHPRNWFTVAGEKTEKPGIWDFDTNGVFPVDRIDLAFPAGNHLIQGVFDSRRTPKAPWQSRHRGLFYRLTTDGTVLAGDPIVLSPTADRFWRMEIVSEHSGIGDRLPRLKMGWLPHRLVFLARNNPPFTLAFGSAETPPAAGTVDLLFKKIDTTDQTGLIRPASTGQMIELGGAGRLSPAPPPLPWRKWVLWAVLIASVLILATMAIRLYRQME